MLRVANLEQARGEDDDKKNNGIRQMIEKSKKVHAILCLSILLGLTACSGEASPSGVSNIPEGRHWQVTLDGGAPEEGITLIRQQLPGRLGLMATGGPGFSGIILLIPMEEKYQTGVFEEGVELELPGVADFEHCEHTHDSNTPNASVSVNITENSRDLFAASFTFTDVECKQDTVVVSGSGVITEKKAVKPQGK